MSEQVFISYRRDGGDAIASLVSNKLKAQGYTVFYDYDSLGGGCFDERIFDAIEHCRDFVLILSPHSLDRCVNGDDWVRSEIRSALRHQKNIVPVMLPDFTFPETLPEDIAEISRYNAVPFVMAYLDAVIGVITERLTKQTAAKPSAKKRTSPMAEDDRVAPLLRRMRLFLEDGEFDKGNEYAEKVLDLAPECAEAYVGKLLASLKVKKQENLKRCAQPFDGNPLYKKAIRFADDELKRALTEIITHINDHNEATRLSDAYDEAKTAMRDAKTETAYKHAAKLFQALGTYKDAATLAQDCLADAVRAKEAANLTALNNAKAKMAAAKTEEDYLKAEALFRALGAYQDAPALAKACADEAARAKEAVCMAAFTEAANAMDAAKTEADYLSAASLFSALGAYKNAPALAEQCVAEAERLKEAERTAALDREYDAIVAAMNAAQASKEYTRVSKSFQALGTHRDAAALAKECQARAKQAAEAERIAEMDAEYQRTVERMRRACTPFQWLTLMQTFDRLKHHKDAKALAATCCTKLEEAKAEALRLQNEKNTLQATQNQLRASDTGKTQLPLIRARVARLTTVINLYASSKLDLNVNELAAIRQVLSEKESFDAKCREAEHYDSYLDTYPLLKLQDTRAQRLEQAKREFANIKAKNEIWFGCLLLFALALFGVGSLYVANISKDDIVLLPGILGICGIILAGGGGLGFVATLLLCFGNLYTRLKCKRAVSRIQREEAHISRIPSYTPDFDAEATRAKIKKRKNRLFVTLFISLYIVVFFVIGPIIIAFLFF